MLRSRNATPALLTTVLASLALVAGFGAATAATAAPAPAPAPAASQPSSVTEVPLQGGDPASSVALPGGDRVVYQGKSGQRGYNVVGANGLTVPFIKLDPGNGHVYVVPTAALSHATSLDLAQYDVPELSHAAPAAASKPALRPQYPMHIIQIDANDTSGAPAQDAVSIVLNVDSVSKFAAVVPDYGGVTRVAVPVGNYAIYTGFIDDNAKGVQTALHFVLQDDLVVPGSGGAVTFTANERAAGSLVSAATPQPAASDEVTLNLIRTDATGDPVALQAVSPQDVYVSPQAAPTVGELSSQVMWDAQSPPGARSPYRYDLAFPAVDNVPANEGHPVPAAQLATLHYTFDTDAANKAHTGLYQIGAVNLNVGGEVPAYQVTVPESLADYVTAPLPTRFTWMQSYQAELGKAPDEGYAYMEAGNTPAFAAGQDYWRTWAHGPLTPQAGQYTGPNICFSCVSGTEMGIDFGGETSDSEPQTAGYFGVPYGYNDPTVQNFTAYLNGKKISSDPGEQGARLENIPQKTGTYRAVYDVDASGISAISQSTKSHTDLAFVYHPAGDPGSALPADSTCYEALSDPASCQILPLLDLNYQLDTDGTDTSHGPSILALTVGHESYDGQGSQAPAASAKVQVSFNGGATWITAVTAPTSHNQYLATWPNTGAKGSRPWLRVTATDTIGGSITQTIANAYTIG